MSETTQEPVKVENRQSISMEELSKHNTEKDCWLGLNGLVVNLTADFLEQHPGGPEVVSCMAGQDATKEFEDIAHSESARTWASQYIIGYIEGASEEVQQSDLVQLGGSQKGGGGGSGPIIGAVIALVIAAVAFFVFKSG